VSGAVAVSVPYLLREAAERMAAGPSRLYQTYLLRKLKHTYRKKFAGRELGPIPTGTLTQVKDFFDFDDAVTAPLHGYRDAIDYYARASCRQRLHAIRVPTLLLHAVDDPFMTPRVIPRRDEVSEFVTLEISEHGGHVGFVAGSPFRPRYWLEERIPRFLLGASPTVRIDKGFPRATGHQTR
jgi:predicted alpha/beta-fold hydrolase